MFAKVLSVSGLVAVSSAHMMMASPVPYGKSTLNNSPLDASGSDYPCKMREGAFDAQGASNVIKAGGTGKLSFVGSAVHGGGSCQISVTTDATPNKNTKFKVIKSIEGGCPANAPGNLGGGPDSHGAASFDYTIPSEMPAGNYTIAWTWFNKVGNREMYMNCGPLTVTGGGGGGSSGSMQRRSGNAESFLQSLPDMFVANVKSQGDCGTKEGTDVKFPNPGKELQTESGAALGAPVGNCGGGGGGGSDTGGSDTPSAPSPKPKPGSGTGTPGNAPGSAPSQVPGSAPAPTQPATPNPSTGSPNGGSPPKDGSSKIPGGVFMPVPKAPTPSGGSPSPTGTPNGTTPGSSGPGSSDPGSSGPGGSDASPGGAFAAGTHCTTEGEWNCLGGKSFQRCASGTWSAVMQMAEGMQCQAGKSPEIKMMAEILSQAAPSNVKRGIRRALRFKA